MHYLKKWILGFVLFSSAVRDSAEQAHEEEVRYDDTTSPNPTNIFTAILWLQHAGKGPGLGLGYQVTSDPCSNSLSSQDS